ncbi:hypothetical protein K4L44_14960 [Halosquirtibacter laminarini]|uniref:Uncharacterized protein n=1 Tax=Halosquirtibacter laminarini TaxID=3374600 RepID=A0AC61NE25_9BACT|nr:hypothetical protein K4L44_14960 [Prolixibacteraceae bacterium]
MKRTMISSFFKFPKVPIASLQVVFYENFQDYYSYAYSKCYSVQMSCDIITQLFLQVSINHKDIINYWKDKKSIYFQIDERIQKLERIHKEIDLDQIEHLEYKRKAQLKRIITVLTPKQKKVIISYQNMHTNRWYKVKKLRSFYCEFGKILQLLDSLPTPQLKIKPHMEISKENI